MCPYLSARKMKTIRMMSTTASTKYPSVSRLVVKATKCPAMRPALLMRSHEQVTAGYASLTDGVIPIPVSDNNTEGKSLPPPGVCPHAHAAVHPSPATQLPEGKSNPVSTSPDTRLASHVDEPTWAIPHQPHVNTHPVHFDYATFYAEELEKKHEDKSYRYFNNINRLANKFPVAHTANTQDEVDVWCSNDYLGMGRNPLVLDTMQ